MKVRLVLENEHYMDIELYPNIAPISVANFLDLVDKKFYDGIVFHRIIKDFMAQVGGYYFDESKREISLAKRTKEIKGEFKSNGFDNKLLHKKGVLSMARTYVKDSASSQIFICTADAPHLDGEYAAFGKVVGEESFKVLEELNNAHTVNAGGGLTDFPYPIIRIKTIERLD